MRLYSSGEVCACSGRTASRSRFRRLNSWVVNGIIKPFANQPALAAAIVQRRPGACHRDRSRPSTWCVQGRIDVSGDVMEVIMDLSEELLLKRFAEGRRFIAVDNGTKKVVRKLIDKEECQSSPTSRRSWAT